MTVNEAVIIPFPKVPKSPVVRKGADLYHCWDKRLINPMLKKTYRDNISWIERWYLEARHLANKDQWEHPIVKAVSQDQEFNRLLRWCCLEDIKIMQTLAEDPVYRESSATQRRRLIIWHNKFAALILNRETDSRL
jgi:hypothetical protein